MLQGRPTVAQSAVQKSVHFTLGSSIIPKTEQIISQSAIEFGGHPEVSSTTAIHCVDHGRPLKGVCIDPEFKKRRKLCVDCLWQNQIFTKMQQGEFIKVLQNKIQISGPNFFDHLNKIIKKEHLQKEIDDMFFQLKTDVDRYIDDLYSQFMWWSRNGMGSLIQSEGFISNLLFDDRIIYEIQELVLKGRPMEASDATINVCADLINSDATLLASLPDHLKRTVESCDSIIKGTLKELMEAFRQFKEYHFEFKNIPSDVYVPALRIPGTSGQIGQFGLNFSHPPGVNFINSTSQLQDGSGSQATQMAAISTSYHQRFSSNLAASLNPKLFADARDLHQSQIWALCKVSNQIIAAGDWQGNIKLIGLTHDGQYQFIESFNHGRNVYALTMAYEKDNIIISAGQNEKDEWSIKVWDIERVKCIKEMKGHSNYIFAVVMPNPAMIVSCSYDETVRVWDFEKGKSITIFKEFKTSFNDLCVWSPHEVITCSDDKAIRLFNISSGQMKMQIFDQYFVNGISRVSQKEIAVGNFKGEILIINVPDQKIVKRMGSHKNFVWRIKTIDADLIATASFDKTVKIWEWKSGSLVASLEGHTEIVRSLEILEENFFLISASDDRTIKIWKLV